MEGHGGALHMVWLELTGGQVPLNINTTTYVTTQLLGWF